MENKQNTQPSSTMNFKSHIIVPFIFVITTIVAILFAASDSFIEGLEPFIVWFYFAIVIAYLIVAVIEARKSNEKSEKRKNFIYVMALLSSVSAVHYIVFYLIFK